MFAPKNVVYCNFVSKRMPKKKNLPLLEVFIFPKFVCYISHLPKLEFLVKGQTILDVWCPFVRSQKWGVRYPLLKDEHVQVHSMFEKLKLEYVRWVISI